MKRTLPLAFACAVAIAVSVQAQRELPKFSQGTRVIVVGEITSPPKGALEEKKMQVAIGPRKRDYTLHFSDAQLIGLSGQRIDEDGFDDGQWVRAEGTVMDDPRRIRVDRVQIIAPDRKRYGTSTFFRSGYDYGYTIPFEGTTLAVSDSPRWTEGTGVVVVGEITSQPKPGESKMQVGIGPSRTDYTLHMKGAPLLGLAGQRLEENDLKDKMWVRAEGMVMDDPRRIKVDRLQVIAPDRPRYGGTAFFRPGWDYGYVTSVAGVRQTFPVVETAVFAAGPVTLIGRVSDDTGAFESTRKVQVMSAGNEWTLNVPEEAMVVDAKGEKISVHEIDEGQWIRATGWQTDDLRMRVLRVENIGPEAAFRTSRFFRTDYPLGYFERGIEGRTAFDTVNFRGTVTRVNREFGYVVVRDARGDLHKVYADMAVIDRGGSHVGLTEIRVGDTITVSGRLLR